MDSVASPGSDSPVTEADLRAALDGGEIRVFFQPKIALSRQGPGHITGAEALVRWEQPGFGMRSPDTFIPVAEHHGLIAPLTEQVLRESVTRCKGWEAIAPNLSVAVNLSPFLLHELHYPDFVDAIVREAGLPSHFLCLEITESGVMADYKASLEILTRFRVKGFPLSIDDFGTGYSSLVELHRLPFNELKVDKSFVAEYDSESEARTIVEAVIQLGHKLGLSLCAEGVETKSVLEGLCALGCDSAQGYLFSRPLPGDEFARFVANWDPVAWD